MTTHASSVTTPAQPHEYFDPTGYAFQYATSTIPIVLIGTADPVATGLATSLAHPGHNITRVLSNFPELSGKWLELLKAAVPGASRIAVLSNPANPAHRLGPPGMAPSVRPLSRVAQALGVTLQRVEAQTLDEIEEAFRAMAARRADALVVLSDQVFWTHRTRIVDWAREHHLPTICERRPYVEAGGLMAYGANEAELFRHAAALVDKILKGAKPADLPIEQPMKFDLVINLKTAKALGLTIPPSLLFQATEVIR